MWQKAYFYFEKYHQLITWLNKDAQQSSVNRLRTQYETKQQQEKIELLEAENKLSALQLKASQGKRVIFIAFALFSAVVLFLAVSRYYSKKEAQRLHKHNIAIQENEKQLMLLSNAFKNTSDGVWITNEKFEIEVVNNAYVKHTHRNKCAIIGEKVQFAPVHGQPNNLAEKLQKQASLTGAWHGEIFDQKASGDVFPLELEIEAIKNEQNDIIHYLGVFRDITEKKQTQEQLAKLATHDDLTGLVNRTLLHELVMQACLQAKRSNKTPAILLLDVKNFKKVNDSLGHSLGDQLIKAISQRLKATLYEKDIIARLSGAEFALLVENSTPKHGAATVARKVIEAFEQEFIVEQQAIKLNISIGINLVNQQECNAQELMRQAALALFNIKSASNSGFSFYHDQMNDEVSEIFTQEQKLLAAIKDDLFIFHYQPLVNTQSNKITGAEALIRWQTLDGKIIYPDNFIPLAEKSGFIDQIDKITINKVFKQVAIWQKQQLALGAISINLSAKIFAQQDILLPLLADKLDEHQISASLIKIEITEGMLLQDLTQAISTMNKLKSLGFKLALDDFGTGFSSLNYLKQFPIDILKIDRSFIKDLNNSAVDESIIKAIIDLASSLNLSVVAEGVETQAHLSILQQLTCHEYQGYFFSKPIDKQEFELLVRQQSL